MRRRGIQVKPIFLGVLAVIAFGVIKAKKTFFEDRVFAIPQRQRKTKQLILITDASDAIVAPTIGPRTRLIMRKIAPCITIGGVVLTHRAPRTVAEVRPPFSPRGGIGQTLGFYRFNQGHDQLQNVTTMKEAQGISTRPSTHTRFSIQPHEG